MHMSTHLTQTLAHQIPALTFVNCSPTPVREEREWVSLDAGGYLNINLFFLGDALVVCEY